MGPPSQDHHTTGISVPVVNNAEDMRLTGIIHEANVIQAYNEAVKEARGEEQGID